jgi:hypothetical protein
VAVISAPLDLLSIVRLLSPVEQSYLNGTRQFTKAQQRYIRYRLRKKLRAIDEQCRDAAAAKLLRLEEAAAVPQKELSLVERYLGKVEVLFWDSSSR